MSGTGIALAGALAPMLLSNAAVPAIHSAGAQEASDIEVITAGEDAVERMTVPIWIGRSGPYRFLVDTGAQNTVIASSLAAELALPAGPAVRVITVAGNRTVGTAEIDQILLGRRTTYGLRVPLLERGHIGADGILGIDSMQRQRVLFDFAKNTIAIGTAKELGGTGGFDIVVRGHRRANRLVVTDAEVDGVPTDVVIDTGADSTIGNRALQRALARKAHNQPAVLHSVTGQQIAAEIDVAGLLSVGKLGIQNVAIAYADAPVFAELELEKRPALLLGILELRAFKRVAIDFSTWKVLFDLPEP